MPVAEEDVADGWLDAGGGGGNAESGRTRSQSDRVWAGRGWGVVSK